MIALALLACDKGPDSGTPPRPLPSCPAEPCAEDVATAEAVGPAFPAWFGQQLSAADDGESAWLAVGAPVTPGGYYPGRGELYSLPDLTAVAVWESNEPWDLAGAAVAVTPQAGSSFPIVAVSAFEDSENGPNSGTVFVLDEPSAGATLQDSARLTIYGEGAAFRRPRFGIELAWLSLGPEPRLELCASAPGLFAAQTADLPFGSAIYAFDAEGSGETTAASAARTLRSDDWGLAHLGGWDGDGDGIDDLVVTEVGVESVDTRVHRFASPWVGDLTLDDAATTWTFGPFGDGPGDPTNVRDVTGDGRPDLAIPVSLWSGEISRAGAVFVVEGGGDLEGGDGFGIPLRWAGTEVGEAVGAAVVADDVDGDGEADLIITASSVPPAATPGKVAVFLGPLEVSSLSLDDAAAVVHGETSSDYFGQAVATADPDRDGQADLIIGANGWGGDQGKVYLIPGSALFP